MSDLTQARIAAALALAEALYADCMERGAYEQHTAGDDTYNAVVAKLRAYAHAMKPKLRTRAEVDREIATVIRRSYEGGPGSVCYSVQDSLLLSRLCSEPTAPELEPSCSVCNDKGYTDNCGCRYVHSCKMCDRGLDWVDSGASPMLNPNRTRK